MLSFDWESFLKRWSGEILESMGSDRHTLPAAVLESGWLGYPGATEEQIARAEARLGMALPPSYRRFLQVTNGWRQTTPFINHLWSTDEIEWFTTRHQAWIDTLVAKADPSSTHSSNHNSAPLSISNEEYFVYGEEQDCSKIRTEYLHHTLEISDRGESAIYLLNPQVITTAGEWEAWFLGDWLPGADRYPSFQEMMQAEYENFLELRDPSTPSSPSLMPSNSESSTPMLTPLAPSSPLAIIPPEADESTSELSTNREPLMESSPDSMIDEWQDFASFTLEFQTRPIDGQMEQRTLVRDEATGLVTVFSSLNPEAAQHWIASQLNLETQAPLETAAVVEITQLQAISSARWGKTMVADTANPLFAEAIHKDESFTLKAFLHVVDSVTTTLSEKRLVYRAQCFAYNLSTRFNTCLADITNSVSMTDTSDSIALFPNIQLNHSGVYRLKVCIIPQNIPASPVSFKVPMLHVI